jgi:hypothetical protein
MYGEIEYNEEGLPMCELCGKHFKRVLNHVRMKHDGMSEKEYKKMFGFDIGKGICSKESAELSRKYVEKYYDKVVAANLISNGEKTRFIKGSQGRTRDKVSAQTMNRLKQTSFLKTSRS